LKVKICGIKSLEAATAAVEAGADFIGFVFAESKRRITPDQAKQIAVSLPSYIKKVGVFVNESKSTILDTASYVGIDYIQLHGDEPPEFASSLNYPIIKAFSIKNLSDIKKYNCNYYLIDSPSGGSGEPFDWKALEKVELEKNNLILAGGLTIENIKQAIYTVNPAIVDVSSGVETNYEKDPVKIKSFVKNAKQAFQQLKERE
jgi:phosphoribosylanthranilate isomerase